MDETTAQKLITDLVEIAHQINAFARNLKAQRAQDKTKMTREESAEYSTSSNDPVIIIDDEGFNWLESPDLNAEPPFSLKSVIYGLESS